MKLRLTAPTQPRRRAGPWLLSIAVHTVAVLLLVRAVVAPARLHVVFNVGGPRPAVEHVVYTTPAPVRADTGRSAPPRTRPPAEPAPSSGAPSPPVSILLTTPTVISDEIPPVVAGGGGAGGGADSGGAPSEATVMQPGFTNPRGVMPADAPAAAPAVALADALRADFSAALKARRDSIAANPTRDPRDWTVEKDGKKYGIDPAGIHLGAFTIPTAVLALLPSNLSKVFSANPVTVGDQRRAEAVNSELRARGPVDADMKSEIQRIRERVARERAAKQAQSGQTAP